VASERRVGSRQGERKGDGDNDDDGDDEAETDPERARNLKLLGEVFKSLAGVFRKRTFGFAEYQTRGRGSKGTRCIDLVDGQGGRADCAGSVWGGAILLCTEK
jgi:hypothetical protein